MNIDVVQSGALVYVVIDGLYTESELAAAQKEIEFLQHIQQGAESTKSAKTDDIEFKKTGGGIFLDCVYKNRDHSVLLKINRKLFSKEVVVPLSERHCFFRHIDCSNYDSTLLNFYGHGQRYDSHVDRSVFTAVTFFKIGEFSGGEFLFPEDGVTINPIANRVVLFPGCVKHQANPIVAAPNNYRVTMAQFINYKME